MLKTSNSISFAEFCKPITLLHPQLEKPTMIELGDNQLALFEFCEKHPQVIVSKYRQGGFSTLCLLYLLWKIHTNSHITCGFMGANHMSGIRHMEILAQFISCLSNSEKYVINNKHIFNSDTKSSITVIPTNPRIGCKLHYMVFDELAYSKLTTLELAAIWPMVDRCIIVSTPHKRKGLFYELYQRAKQGKNQLTIFNCDIAEREPDNRRGVNEIYGEFLEEYPDFNRTTNKLLHMLTKTNHFSVVYDYVELLHSDKRISIKHLAKALAGLRPVVGRQEACRLVFDAVITHFFKR